MSISKAKGFMMSVIILIIISLEQLYYVKTYWRHRCENFRFGTTK